MTRLRQCTVVGVAALLLCPPFARADVAGSISSELQANGVPNVSVTVATPAPATSGDLSQFQADPSADDLSSLNPYNLLSPDPTHPLPIATVRFGPSATSSLPGTVAPPGEAGAYVEDSQLPIWEAAIMDAIKHRLAAGTSLTGIAFQPTFPGRDATEPDAYVATPDTADYNPAPPVQLLTTAAVQLQIQLGLPQQYSAATVTVQDAAGGQRVATIAFDQPASAFPTDNLAALVAYADSEQSTLNGIPGANIGEVIVVSRDPQTQTPLFTHAADVMWGDKFEWSSPTVKAFAEEAGADSAK